MYRYALSKLLQVFICSVLHDCDQIYFKALWPHAFNIMQPPLAYTIEYERLVSYF